MSLFHHTLAFQPIDPLGDGLGDEIEQERQEPEAITLEEQLDITLAEKWDDILHEAHQESDWSFAEDE